MAVLADGSLLQPPELKTVLVRYLAFAPHHYSHALIARHPQTSSQLVDASPVPGVLRSQLLEVVEEICLHSAPGTLLLLPC